MLLGVTSRADPLDLFGEQKVACSFRQGKLGVWWGDWGGSGQDLLRKREDQDGGKRTSSVTSHLKERGQ